MENIKVLKNNNNNNDKIKNRINKNIVKECQVGFLIVYHEK